MSAAPFTVRRLLPALAGDSLALFDRSFPDNPDWSGCYCRFYHSPESPWDSSPSSSARHRRELAERIEAGVQHGFLAYSACTGGEAVGWLNAGPREGFENPRGYEGDADAWLMCFVVDPEWRGRGVGTALVQGALAAFREDGLRSVEAFPKAAAPAPAPASTAAETADGESFATMAYKGALSTYLKAGFRVTGESQHGAVVVRAELQGAPGLRLPPWPPCAG